MKQSSRKEAAMKRYQTSKDNQAAPIDNIKTNYKSKGLHELCLFETINPEVCRKTVGSKTNPAQRFKKKIGQSPTKKIESDGRRAQSEWTIEPIPERAKELVFRLISFKDNLDDYNAGSLAKNGFYLEPNGAVVRCFSCEFRVEDLTKDDTCESAEFHNTGCEYFIAQVMKSSQGNPAPTGISRPIERNQQNNRSTPLSMSSMTSGLQGVKLTGPPESSSGLHDYGLHDYHPHYSSEVGAKQNFMFDEQHTTAPPLLENRSVKLMGLPDFPGNNDKAKEMAPKIYHAHVYSADHRELLEGLDLYSEKDRLKSFLNWHENALDKKALARSGFFYLGNRDRTQCFNCMGVLKNWRPGDDINTIHSESFPTCSFIRNLLRAGEDSDPIDFSVVRPPPLVPFEFPTLPHGDIETSEPQQPIEQTNQSPANDIYSSNESESIVLENYAPEPNAFSLPNSRSDRAKQAAYINPVFNGKDVKLNQLESRSAFRPIHPNQHSPLPSQYELRSTNAVPNRIKPIPNISSFPNNLTQTSISSSSRQSITSNQDSYATIEISESGTAGGESPPVQLPPWQSTRAIEMLIPTTPRPQPKIGQPEMSDRPQTPLRTPETWMDDLDPLKSHPDPSPLNPSLNPGVATGTSKKGTFDFDDYLTESDRNLFREMFPCIDPKRPSMKFYEDRISSFEGKWTHSGPPTISDIAKAGFFLFDVDASVRCWYCDVRVSDVSRQWSPWEEHAKQYPSCHFLLRNRGHNFVEAALSSVTDNEPEPALSYEYQDSYDSEDEFSQEEEPAPPIVDPREEAKRNKAEFIKGMGSEIVANVVEMGFDPKFIKKVIRRQIRDHSTCFATTDALLDALVTEENDLIDLGSSSSSDDDEEAEIPVEPEDFYEAREHFDEDELHPSEQESQGAEANRSNDEHSTPEAQVAEENHRVAELSPEEERRVQSELRRLRDEKRCKVCLDRDAEMVFIPCGHLSTCLICTQSLRQCPVCRMKINRSYRTFPS